MELDLKHEPSLNHWARRLADDDISTGYHTNWDHAYECAWHSLDAEYNYSYIQEGNMGSKELSRIWEVLHNYREDCIPEGIDHHDEEWDDICYTMARLKEMLND